MPDSSPLTTKSLIGLAEELVDRFIAAAYSVEDNSFYEQDPS